MNKVYDFKKNLELIIYVVVEQNLDEILTLWNIVQKAKKKKMEAQNIKIAKQKNEVQVH